VRGREHARLGRNNQDGWAVRSGQGRLAAVVTDGCGSQPRSEVGAQLGARFLAGWLLAPGDLEALPARALEALCGFLDRVASELDGGAAARALEELMLFTFLAVVREGQRTIAFGVGDGALLIDDTWIRLDAGPDNAPDYAAYRLARGLAPRTPEVQRHFHGEAGRCVLMTDGLPGLPAGGVERLVDGAGGWTNPFTLQRRLTLATEAHALADDATLVVAGGG
jgi:hypothetical protein